MNEVNQNTKKTDIKIEKNVPVKAKEAESLTPKSPTKLGQVKLFQNMRERFASNAFYLKLNPKTKKILKIFGASFGVLIVLLIILALVVGLRREKGNGAPTPSPKAQKTPESEVVRNPSRYATDSAVLAIEEEVLEMDEKLRGVDLKESGLRPPQIEFDIKFE